MRGGGGDRRDILVVASRNKISRSHKTAGGCGPGIIGPLIKCIYTFVDPWPCVCHSFYLVYLPGGVGLTLNGWASVIGRSASLYPMGNLNARDFTEVTGVVGIQKYEYESRGQTT